MNWLKPLGQPSWRDDLAQQAKITASSDWKLNSLPADGPWLKLTYPVAQLIPLTAKSSGSVELKVRSSTADTLRLAWRISDRIGNFTPEQTLSEKDVTLKSGEQSIEFSLPDGITENRYVFLTLYGSEAIEVAGSERRVTGLADCLEKI